MSESALNSLRRSATDFRTAPVLGQGSASRPSALARLPRRAVDTGPASCRATARKARLSRPRVALRHAGAEGRPSQADGRRQVPSASLTGPEGQRRPIFRGPSASANGRPRVCRQSRQGVGLATVFFEAGLLAAPRSRRLRTGGRAAGLGR